MQVHDKLYINGQWVAPRGTGTIDVIDPSTEEVCGVVPSGNVDDVNAAVAAAKTAFRTWSRTSEAKEGSGSTRAAAPLREQDTMYEQAEVGAWTS